MTDKIQTDPDRYKILSYSQKKFHKEGFYKTSMDEIASELHISKKTIYKHFPSKDILLKEICNFTTREISAMIDGIVDSDGDVVFKFVKLLNMYSNFTVNISEKWLKDISIHAPNIKEDIDKSRNEKIIKVMTKLLDQGKKEKLILNYPTQLILNSFTASIFSAVNPEFLMRNKFSLSDAFKYTYNMLLNGILTEKGKEKYSKEKLKLSKEILK